MIEHPNLRLDDEDEEPETQDPTKTTPPPQVGPAEQALFKARTVLIFGEINMNLARDVTAKLLALAAKSDDPIRVVVNSPGGHVEAGDTIHDMLRFVGPQVKVLGTGWVASAGAHIFLGAAKENRFCLPNTRFLLHQPSGGFRGAAADIDIEAREIVRMRARLNRIIAEETGQPLERVEKDTERNYWMNAEEAKAYGVVAHIVRDARDMG